MSVMLPQILRDNMDQWKYDNGGKMVPVKGATFKVIQAIAEMNLEEEKENQASDDAVIQ